MTGWLGVSLAPHTSGKQAPRALLPYCPIERATLIAAPVRLWLNEALASRLRQLLAFAHAIGDAPIDGRNRSVELDRDLFRCFVCTPHVSNQLVFHR